jgi:hypothetical protein
MESTNTQTMQHTFTGLAPSGPRAADDTTEHPREISAAETRSSVGQDAGPSQLIGQRLPGDNAINPSPAATNVAVVNTPFPEQRQHVVSAQQQPNGMPESRPALTTPQTGIDRTISQLHVPGEYPKGTPTAEAFENGIL